MATYAEIMGQVKDLRDQHKYPEAMELIHQTIVAVEGRETSSSLWYWGAGQINAGSGEFSAFVRAYAKAMSGYRNGQEISDTEIQVAANLVASRAVEEFIKLSGPPDLRTLGYLDGAAATEKEFDGDLSAWSGNMLLVLMGEPFFFDTYLRPKDGDTYALLAALGSTYQAGAAAFGWTLESDSVTGAILKVVGDLWKATTNNDAGFFETLGFATTSFAKANDWLVETYGKSTGIGDIVWGDLFLGTTKSDNGLGGGRDADIVNGGKGDDTLFGSLDWDVLDGGVGVDKLTYEELGVRLTIDLENTENLSTFVARVIKDRLGTDNVFSIEKIVGSVQEDTVVLKGIIDNARTSKLLIDGQTGGDRVDVQAADGVWLVDLRDPNQQFIQENVVGGERVLSLNPTESE